MRPLQLRHSSGLSISPYFLRPDVDSFDALPLLQGVFWNYIAVVQNSKHTLTAEALQDTAQTGHNIPFLSGPSSGASTNIPSPCQLQAILGKMKPSIKDQDNKRP